MFLLIYLKDDNNILFEIISLMSNATQTVARLKAHGSLPHHITYEVYYSRVVHIHVHKTCIGNLQGTKNMQLKTINSLPKVRTGVKPTGHIPTLQQRQHNTHRGIMIFTGMFKCPC